jgi:hypothetical protein
VVGENGIEEGPASAIWGSSYSSAAFVSIGLIAMVIKANSALPAGEFYRTDPPIKCQ